MNRRTGISFRSALHWAYAGAAVRLAGQFFLALVLARILGPEPYGILVVTLLPIGLATLISDVGLSSSLIQRLTISDDLVRACIWWQVTCGMILGLILAACAMPLAQVIHCPDATYFLVAVAFFLPIQTLGLIPTALLKRELRFREVQIASVISTLLGSGFIGLPMALNGWGAWSLITAQCATVVINTVIVWWYVKPAWTPRPQPWPSMLTRFSSAIFFTNLANWLINSMESILLVRFQGPIALGVYNRLSLLSTSLIGYFLPPLQGVLFAHHSRQQDDIYRVRSQWLRLSRISVAIFTLVALPLLFAPELVISLTLGQAWLPNHQVLPPLAIIMLANSLLYPSGPVLQAIGRPGREFAVQITTALLGFPLLAWAATSKGLIEFAWTMAGIAILRCALLVFVLTRTLRATMQLPQSGFR